MVPVLEGVKVVGGHSLGFKPVLHVPGHLLDLSLVDGVDGRNSKFAVDSIFLSAETVAHKFGSSATVGGTALRQNSVQIEGQGELVIDGTSVVLTVGRNLEGSSSSVVHVRGRASDVGRLAISLRVVKCAKRNRFHSTLGHDRLVTDLEEASKVAMLMEVLQVVNAPVEVSIDQDWLVKIRGNGVSRHRAVDWVLHVVDRDLVVGINVAHQGQLHVDSVANLHARAVRVVERSHQDTVTLDSVLVDVLSGYDAGLDTLAGEITLIGGELDLQVV